MSLLDTLEPIIRPFAQDLFDIANAQGLHPRVTSARRSHTLQEQLYRRFQEGLSRYPAAVPGNSAHEYGLAFDMVVPSKAYQLGLGKKWREWGGVYGGEEDPIHFEYPSWRTVTDPKGTRIAAAAPSPTEASSANSFRTLVLRAEDTALSWVPTPLRYTIDTAALGSEIVRLSGGSPGPLLYYLEHPAEFFDALYSVLWSLLLQSVRQL